MKRKSKRRSGIRLERPIMSKGPHPDPEAPTLNPIPLGRIPKTLNPNTQNTEMPSWPPISQDWEKAQ